jgi:Ca2+-binding EF-hand superfamily protein
MALTAATMMGGVHSTVAIAQSATPDEVTAKFKAADKNGDGQLTLEEAKAGMPRIAKNFDKLDVDKKGYLTLDQILAAVARTK